MIPNLAKTILVIDDEAACLDAARRVVTQLGYEFMGFQDASAGLKLIRSGAVPAAVIIDLYMPGLDAVGFRIEQLANAACANIPTVVVASNPVTPRLAATIGMPLVQKPLEARELAHALDEARASVAGRPPASSAKRG